MVVEDFDGTFSTDCEAELDARLRSVRRGEFGAFILTHNRKGASLWIHLNGDVAYLHYFPDGEGKHPGYQVAALSSAEHDEPVRLLQVYGGKADGFAMPPELLVPAEVAYQAAREFLRSPSLPLSIRWHEL